MGDGWSLDKINIGPQNRDDNEGIANRTAATTIATIFFCT